LSTSLKRPVRKLVAKVASPSLAFLAMLPGMAEAQDKDGSSMEAMETKPNISDEKGTPSASQPAPASATRLLVDPDDPLWSMDREQIWSGATSQQIVYEIERIFELNRKRIRDDPNLIFLGQEFLLPPVYKPDAATTVPATASPTRSRAAAPEQAPAAAMTRQVSEEAMQEEWALTPKGEMRAPPDSPTGKQAPASEEAIPMEEAESEEFSSEPSPNERNSFRLFGIFVPAVCLTSVAVFVVGLVTTESMAKTIGIGTGNRHREDTVPVLGANEPNSAHEEDAPSARLRAVPPPLKGRRRLVLGDEVANPRRRVARNGEG
jgi:hypothetical protein